MRLLELIYESGCRYITGLWDRHEALAQVCAMICRLLIQMGDEASRVAALVARRHGGGHPLALLRSAAMPEHVYRVVAQVVLELELVRR